MHGLSGLWASLNGLGLSRYLQFDDEFDVEILVRPGKALPSKERGDPEIRSRTIATLYSRPKSATLRGNRERDILVATSLESTATLLTKIRGGDVAARERLCSIYLPILTRWAHGRLPPHARDLAETDDLVQFSLLEALNHIETFAPRHEGAFLAYLRKILLNKIRREISRISKRPRGEVDDQMENDEASVVEQAIGGELFESYENALTKLSEQRREAVIMRVEFGFSYTEIATAMNFPSANAARMKVSRALLNLARNME